MLDFLEGVVDRDDLPRHIEVVTAMTGVRFDEPRGREHLTITARAVALGP